MIQARHLTLRTFLSLILGFTGRMDMIMVKFINLAHIKYLNARVQVKSNNGGTISFRQSWLKLAFGHLISPIIIAIHYSWWGASKLVNKAEADIFLFKYLHLHVQQFQ